MTLLEDAIVYPAASNIAVNAVLRCLERNTTKYTGGEVKSLKVELGAGPWDFSPCSRYI
jgi:hypothetical protein